MTIFDYVTSNHEKVIGENKKFLLSVGRLDFNSEGLILLTNDGELARVLELPEN